MQHDAQTDARSNDFGPNRQLAARQRTLAQHEVTRLLNDLAPERPVRRLDGTAAPVKAYRWPNRCILQNSSRAVSLTWFPGDGDASLGELLVIAWRGTVSLPGSASRPTEEAEIVSELTLHLELGTTGAWGWSAADRELDGLGTSALAAFCRAQLEPRAAAAAR